MLRGGVQKLDKDHLWPWMILYHSSWLNPGKEAKHNEIRSWLLSGNGTLATLARVQPHQGREWRNLTWVVDPPSLRCSSSYLGKILKPSRPPWLLWSSEHGHTVMLLLSRKPFPQFLRTHCSFKENSTKTWVILYSFTATHCVTFHPNWTPWTWH